MTESPKYPRRPASSPGVRGSSPVDPRSSRASVPPSEPRPTSRTSLAGLDLHGERPARLQMVVALVLVLVLVAIPLYLWRRPRAESIAVTTSTAPDEASAFDAQPEVPPPSPVELTEPKTLACQDPGPGRTPPERCDRLEAVELALKRAIEETAACAEAAPEGGAIVYLADVSFKRGTVTVLVPKAGRTLKSWPVVQRCQAAVKGKLKSVSLEGVAHQHARYKIAVTATYRTAPE